MVQAECTDFVIEPSGVITVTWVDGHQSQYDNMALLKSLIAELDAVPTNAELILMGWFLARSSDASNVNLVEGKKVTFDLSAANPIRVQ